MKKYLWIMVLCLCFAKGNAQGNADARKVLDATAAQVTGQGGVKARFKADSFTDGNLQGSVSGTMCLQGEKFRMDTPEMVTWYNGETQWSYVKANEEVNVSVPTPEERQAMNPYAFVHLYKEGYGLALKETVLRGKPCYEVTLKRPCAPSSSTLTGGRACRCACACNGAKTASGHASPSTSSAAGRRSTRPTSNFLRRITRRPKSSTCAETSGAETRLIKTHSINKGKWNIYVV